MARPTKQGIDYFPLDCQFDDKVELFVAECGAEGLGILVTIWQLIYSNEGYFIRNDDNLLLLVRRRTMSEMETIQKAISSALNRCIFDPLKEKKYGILTSKAILKRYLVAARKKKEVSVAENYSYLCVLDAGNHGCRVVLDRGNATKEEEEEEVKEEEKEEKILSGKNARPHPPYAEIVKFLNREAGTDFKPSTDVTKRHIKARWHEGFSLEDFKAVITSKTDEWKTDAKMCKYLRPQTLFGTKFEAYLQEAQDNAPRGPKRKWKV